MSQELIEAAERLGQDLARRKLTTSQIRNIFGMVRQIKMNWTNDPKNSYRQAVLLKPKISYQAERLRKKVNNLPDLLNSDFMPALDAVIDALDDNSKKERFERFTDFFEAIVAYHKKHGGADS